MEGNAPNSYRLERLGNYAIVRVLGEGGMGIVYEAVEDLSRMRVALKVLHSALARSAEARDRFFVEMRVMAGLRHPNIVQSYSSREIDGRLVMVLEYLEGHTLREELRLRSRLPVDRAIVIASAVASALVAAHESVQPIVHRDLKPENLMLLPNGSIKVMDFGIAKVLSQRIGGSLTTQSVGTVQYMSPEQADNRTISPRTDLYALGLVLYEMLTGRILFESSSLVAILRHHCETPPAPFPPELRREIPAALEALVFQLLEKAPESRPPDARVVLAALENLRRPSETRGPTPLARGDLAAPRVGNAQPAGKAALDTIAVIDGYADKRRAWWIGGAVGVIGLTAIGVVLWLVVLPAIAESPKRRFTSPSAPLAEGTGAPSGPCTGDVCVPFAPPDRHAVDVDALLDQADAFARQTDPDARIANVSFVRALSGGTLDLTRPHAMAVLTYQTSGGTLMVQVADGQLRGTKNLAPDATRSLPVRECSFKSVWAVVSKLGLRSTDMESVGLTTSHLNGASMWIFMNAQGESVMVSAQTCSLIHG